MLTCHQQACFLTRPEVLQTWQTGTAHVEALPGSASSKFLLISSMRSVKSQTMIRLHTQTSPIRRYATPLLCCLHVAGLQVAGSATVWVQSHLSTGWLAPSSEGSALVMMLLEVRPLDMKLHLQWWWNLSTSFLLSASHTVLCVFLYQPWHASDPLTSQSKELDQSKVSHTKPNSF